MTGLTKVYFSPYSNSVTHKIPHKTSLRCTVEPRYIAKILLPLRPASLTHKNPQRRKIIHGMRPVGHKDRSTDLNMCICRNIPFV